MSSSTMGQSVVLPMRVRNVTAVLGPTNTGKTHLAIERMLGHETGLIGLPLRLLAREVYDRVVERVGAENVALVTGEEKIKPDNPRYWVSTVEAMPQDLKVDFVAVDEIQLAGDPERGHVFTQRLFTARGMQETLLLGAQTMRDTIHELLQGANFVTRPRLSQLSFSGQKKISRLPRRSAVVAFSASDVYAIAELIRRQRGGAAVVLGALSPRTRNAQVALYQSGDVDHLVATDAIGMGLNLDVDHVAFAAIRKFDGQAHRNLTPGEIGQIAGRAGRHMNDGTFGVTGDVEPFPSDVIGRLERHDFEPIKTLQWRNDDLDFATLERLNDSLRLAPKSPKLVRARMADDMIALETVGRRDEIARLATSPASVKRLWEVCQLPDYRKISSASHSDLVAQLYTFLLGDYERIPEDWFAEQVAQADRTDGDIDTLANRIAHIRTWTFISNRDDWLDRPDYWQDKAREIEDRLSDALHEQLTQRFVDRRTSVLMRRLRDSDDLMAEIADDGAIHVEKHYVGRLKGFCYVADAEGEGIHGKAARNAAAQVLASELAMRARRVSSAKGDALTVKRNGRILWRGEEIGQVKVGEDPLVPTVQLLADEHLSGPDREKVQRKLDDWLKEQIEERLRPLVQLAQAEDVTGLARGMAFRLMEHFGILKREAVADDVRALDQPARSQLRKYGVRFGAFNIYLPLLLKPAASEMLTMLWGLKQGGDPCAIPEPPRAGLTSVSANLEVPDAFYRVCGFHLCGPRAVRIDMLERLSDMIRPLVSWRVIKDKAEAPPKGATGDGGFTVQPEMMSILGCSVDELGDVLKSLGFQVERRPVAAETKEASQQVTIAGADAPDVALSDGSQPGDKQASATEAPDAVAAVDASEQQTDVPTPGDEAEQGPTEAVQTTSAETVEAESMTSAMVAAVPDGEAKNRAEAGQTERGDTASPGEHVETAAASSAADEDAAEKGELAPAEPEFLEIWRPRRKLAMARGGRRRPARNEGRSGQQASQDGSDKKERGQERHGQRKSGKPGRRDGKPRKPKPAAAHDGGASKKKVEVDPDSPFAALSKLKKQLEEQSVEKQSSS